MNISFDVFKEYPELQKELSSDEHIFYTKYLAFFAAKLEPLKEEINKEEDSEEDGARFTEINILNTNSPATFWGYSDNLKIRMQGCFSKDDFTKFGLDLENARKGFHN